MGFIIAVVGYGMAVHKRNGNIREELGITNVSTLIGLHKY
jgi:hypothetical protein